MKWDMPRSIFLGNVNIVGDCQKGERGASLFSKNLYSQEGEHMAPSTQTGSLSGSQMVAEQMKTALWKPLCLSLSLTF